MVKVRVLKTPDGEKFYPVTHIKSVIGDNGEMVDVLLDNEAAARESADNSLQEQVTAASGTLATATADVAKLKQHSKPRIYCEVIGKYVYLRGAWHELLNQGYVPYLFRRVKARKRNKRVNPNDHNGWIITKTKSLHYFGRQDFVRIGVDGRLNFVDRRYVDIGEADKADFAATRYTPDGCGLVNAHLNHNETKVLVNWNGRCYLINKGGRGIGYRFRWAIGFAKPRDYRTQTVRPEEVVSTFAEFYVTPSDVPNLENGYWEWWSGWTFGV